MTQGTGNKMDHVTAVAWIPISYIRFQLLLFIQNLKAVTDYPKMCGLICKSPFTPPRHSSCNDKHQSRYLDWFILAVT